MATQTIDHNTLARLIDAGTDCGARIVGQSGGWTVRVQYGTAEQTLTAQRTRQIRLFRKMDTLVAYLKGVGIARFAVDASGYDPDGAKVVRPDRAAALKRAHEAAAYDAWFREQVQIGIDSANAGNLIPAAEVEARFAAKRAATRRRLEGAAK